MTEACPFGTLSFRRTVVCPEDVRIQNNVPNAIETRDVEIETIIQTDNIHIHTEIYSNTQLAVSTETNDESCGKACPDFEHHEGHYMILHSSRSKSIETDSPDFDEDTVPIIHESSSVESNLKQVTKTQAEAAPSDEPQKDSWDEGSRLLSGTRKISEIKKGLCHPDCPNLRISRSTHMQKVNEAGTSFEESDTLTVAIGEDDTAENLATIVEEESVYSIAASVETQIVEDDQDLTDAAEEQLVQENDEDAFVTDEENASVTQDDAESTEAPDADRLTIEEYEDLEEGTTVPAPDTDPLTIEEDEDLDQGTTVPAADTDSLTIEEVEYTDQGTVVPTESILETNIPKSRTEKQQKLERNKWESRAWIIPPSPTRLDQAETRSCAKLIRPSSSQLHRGDCCETQCVSNIRCAATSNPFYDLDCPVDHCSSKTSSTYCRPQEPFTCDRLRSINNAKKCSIAGKSACNRYNSNFNLACRISNDCWSLAGASHSAYTSRCTARSCYTPAYCYSFNTWY